MLRERALQLRSQGASLNEIVSRLGVPKSTIWFWCRNIVLTKEQLHRLYQKQKIGGIEAAEKMRQKRILLTKQLIQRGIKEVGNLSRRDLLIAGAALYWAEGYRKGDGEFGFTNSDPKMIALILRWLTVTCKISKEKIHLRICINSGHKRRIIKIQRFWSNITKLPSSSFSSPTFINVKNKKTYFNSDKYFGTLRVKVRNNVNLKRKIIGMIEGISIGI